MLRRFLWWRASGTEAIQRGARHIRKQVDGSSGRRNGKAGILTHVDEGDMDDTECLQEQFS